MGRSGRATALLAVGMVLIAGCATRNTTGGDINCTPVPNGTCAPPDPQAGFEANHRYAERETPPASATVTANAVAAQVPALLDRIQARPPVTEASVRAVLVPAYPRYDPQVAADTTEGPGIGFGIDVNGACVHGWVTATDRQVETGGLVRDGGCLAMLGH